MKTLIIYDTKYGTTEKCAGILKEKINDPVDLINIKKEKNINISGYDTIIFGMPVYMGRPKRKIVSFCKKNLHALKNKRIGLFLCHMDFENDIDEKIEKFYPKELADMSIIKKGFGGAYCIERMNTFHKWVFEKISETKENKEDILFNEIDEFAKTINN